MIATVIVVAAAPAAAADPVGVALDLTVGGGLYTGEVSDHGGRKAVHARIGLGMSHGPWAVLVDGEMTTAFGLQEARSDAQPMPPAMDFIGFGFGPSLRRELTRGAGLRAHVRLAYTWRWLHGDLAARRTCSVHADCAGGFWSEKPSYPAHGPTVAVGISGRTSQLTWMAVGAELAAGHRTIDRRGLDPDLGGTFVTLSLNLAIGRGHR